MRYVHIAKHMEPPTITLELSGLCTRRSKRIQKRLDERARDPSIKGMYAHYVVNVGMHI